MIFLWKRIEIERNWNGTYGLVKTVFGNGFFCFVQVLSGSGVPNIFNTWEDQGWKEPVIEERFDPDRTILSLEFIKKQAIKTSDKNKR